MPSVLDEGFAIVMGLLAMLILGKSANDKGTQLEKLTHDLLHGKGYSLVNVNMRKSGGEEMDVVADYTMPGLGSGFPHRLLCECKAYRDVVPMNDWLKFLGKLFMEEKCSGQEVSGLFIALSGVNGSVYGHYDELKRHSKRVDLITGMELAKVVSHVYNLISLEQVNNTLPRFTNREVLSRMECYYGGKAYWVVVFEGDAYTILHANGELLRADLLDVIKPLVEDAISARAYIDLHEEAEARKRAISIEKGIIAKIMIDGGITEVSGLESDLAGRHDDFSLAELLRAIEGLIQRELVAQNSERTQVFFHDRNQDDFYKKMVEVYRFLLVGRSLLSAVAEVPIRVLGCDYYDECIDEGMVGEIQRIQGQLPLPNDDVEKTIVLLRLSPQALSRMLYEDPMIVKPRMRYYDQGVQIEEDVNREHRDFVIRKGILQQNIMNLTIFKKVSLYHQNISSSEPGNQNNSGVTTDWSCVNHFTRSKCHQSITQVM